MALRACPYRRRIQSPTEATFHFPGGYETISPPTSRARRSSPTRFFTGRVEKAGQAMARSNGRSPGSRALNGFRSFVLQHHPDPRWGPRMESGLRTALLRGLRTIADRHWPGQARSCTDGADDVMVSLRRR